MLRFIKFRSALALTLMCLAALPVWSQRLVTQPGESPLINIKIQFKTGAADDRLVYQPGTAYLTAHSLSEASTTQHDYQALLKKFYPWDISVGATVDKEITTFSATFHKDHIEAFTPLFVEMLTQPKFSSDDLDRLRDKAVNFLSQDLRQNNDEELGKEALYLQIYQNPHPYGTHNVGTVSGLKKISREDLMSFYQEHFRSEKMTIAVAGGYPKHYPEKLKESLRKGLPGYTEEQRFALPLIESLATNLHQPALPDGRRVTIIEKDTRSVAMSLGFPLEVNRYHKDWAALYLFRSFLGEHRSSNSYLYQRLREARGLNYGDYAYIEYFPRGMYLTQPEPNYARGLQIFQIWIRPVEPETALFTLRATFYEFEKLLETGLNQKQFEATRSFLTKSAPLMVASADRRLGYRLDSDFYGTDDFVSALQSDLANLTVDDVNEAIHRHLQADNMEIVLVSKNAEQLRKDLLKEAPSPMKYNSPKPESVLKEDRVIQNYPLKLDEVKIVPVKDVFR